MAQKRNQGAPVRVAQWMTDGVLAVETSHFKPVNTYREFMSSRGIWCGDGTRLALPFSQENGVRLCSVTSGVEATRLTTHHQVKEVRSSLDGAVLLVVDLKEVLP